MTNNTETAKVQTCDDTSLDVSVVPSIDLGTYIAYVSHKDDTINTEFMRELRNSVEWAPQAKNLVDAIESGDYKLRSWVASTNSTFHPVILMITSFKDNHMIKWAKKCGLPRGFPIKWHRGERIKFDGFLPKFSNDQTEQVPLELETDCVGWFKKMSGFLVQVTTWGGKYWTALSKNSAETGNPDIIFAREAARLAKPYMTLKSINALESRGAHLCGEGMSKLDQCHGSKVENEDLIVTVIGQGSEFDLVNKRVKNSWGEKITKFWSFWEIIEFCLENDFPVSDAVVAVGVSAREFMKLIQDNRDLMDDRLYEEILKKMLTKYPDEVFHIKGNRTHSWILGNTLEGFVARSVSGHPTASRGELIEMINDGEGKVLKVKLPKYTGRTMGVRQGLEKRLSFSEFMEHIRKWAKQWCMTSEGHDYWVDFYTEVWFEIQDDTDKKNKIASHIRYSDKVDSVWSNGNEDERRLEIKKRVEEKIELGEIQPSGPITLIVPFAKDDSDFSDIKRRLEEMGYDVIMGKDKVGKGVRYWIRLVGMASKNSDDSTGPIFCLPAVVKEKWQEKRLSVFKRDFITTIVSLDEFKDKISEYFIVKARQMSRRHTELKKFDETLVESVSNTFTETRLRLEDAHRRGKRVILVVTGPQASGKSTFCNRMKEELNVKCVSADDFMGLVFNPEILRKCHENCQRLCLGYSEKGYDVVVDNTNMKRMDCTMYKMIADATGAELVPVIIGSEFWLRATVSGRKEFIELLEMRCKTRELRTGKSITGRVIERTINNALQDYIESGTIASEKTTIMEQDTWLNTFPMPTYKQGYVDERGTIMWRDSELTRCCEDSLEKQSGVRDSIKIERVKCMISRGLGEFHSTIITPQEYKYLKGINPINIEEYYCDEDTCAEWGTMRISVEDGKYKYYCSECSPFELDIFGHKNGVSCVKKYLSELDKKDHPTCMGVGTATDVSKKNTVMYEVLKWDSINNLRELIDLPDKDMHATLAWTGKNDIHGVAKDMDTVDR